MPTGRERLARQLIERRAAHVIEADQAVITAASADTPPKATVSWRGGSYTFPHVLAYTPVVGDVVALCCYAGSYLILGRPGGFP